MNSREALRRQSIYSAEKMSRMFALPTAEEVRKSSTLGTLG